MQILGQTIIVGVEFDVINVKLEKVFIGSKTLICCNASRYSIINFVDGTLLHVYKGSSFERFNIKGYYY